MSRKAWMAATLVLAVFAVAGYFGFQYYLDNIRPPKVSPSAQVSEYFNALQKKDYKSAYAMVSKPHYPDSYNQFIDRVSMYDPDMTLEITGERINEKEAVVDINIEVPLKFGLYRSSSTMDLVRDKRQWKIRHP